MMILTAFSIFMATGEEETKLEDVTDQREDGRGALLEGRAEGLPIDRLDLTTSFPCG